MIGIVKPSGDQHETEVTEDMIAAGRSVLCEMELLFAGEEFWAHRVYTAMECARLGLPRPALT